MMQIAQDRPAASSAATTSSRAPTSKSPGRQRISSQLEMRNEPVVDVAQARDEAPSGRRKRTAEATGGALHSLARSSLFRPVAALLLLLLLALETVGPSESFFIDEHQSPQTSEWNYNDQTRWRQMHRDCSGRAQSPIDIKHKNVIISQHLRLNFFNYDQKIRFRLSNAHHTIKMNPVGPAYDQELEQAGGGPRPMLNLSTMNDILTANEYVEFTPTAEQRVSADGSAGGSGGAAPTVGGLSGEPMSRLISNGSGAGQEARQQPVTKLPTAQTTAAPVTPPPPPPSLSRAGEQQAGQGKQRERDRHHQDNIEHEREQNHGQISSALGGLFRGFYAGKLAYDGAPTIKLDWLDDGNNEYKLRDIHFHWAERRDNGSEHAIDGRRAAMEMHLVHIKHGLDKSSIGFTSDSVAVIAILIESHRKSNLDFNPIVNELARINSTEQSQEVDYKSLYDLLPNNLQAFYTYSGSLTTPPCYQVVNWIVMAERLNMNAKQIEMFRNLYAPSKHHKDDLAAAAGDAGHPHHDHDGTSGNAEPSSGSEPIMPNVRTLQTLNNRTIMASFTKHGSRLESVTSSINAASRNGIIQLQSYFSILTIGLVFQLALWHKKSPFYLTA